MSKKMSLSLRLQPRGVAVQLEYLNLLKWKADRNGEQKKPIASAKPEFTWGDRYGTTGRMLTFDSKR